MLGLKAHVRHLLTTRGTQVWVFVNKPRKCVVVAFRGTEQVKWRDFLTDVRINPTAFNTERARVSHRPRLDVGAFVRPSTCDAHSRASMSAAPCPAGAAQV